MPHFIDRVIISFIDEDMEHVTSPHYDALVITADINGFDMKRRIVDFTSSRDVLFLNALIGMGKTKNDLNKVYFPLIGFAGKITCPLGVIRWLVILGEGRKTVRTKITFIVIDAHNSYNAILVWTTFNPNKIIA